ncbi:MAG: tRNA lysidine(34) synthetase TilS [Betaproteobacteria bacterium]
MESEITPLNVIVENFLVRYGLEGKRLCVALSGGVDSIILLAVVEELRAKLGLELAAIHVHHGLSHNADTWATFCAEVCNAKEIPLTITKVQVDRKSPAGIEGAARAARYAAFAEEGSPYVLLAQHADDQAETILHQLLRGTGLKGLAGMGEVRVVSAAQSILRPLLGVSRGDIEVEAQVRSVRWIEDESNTDTAYTRNFLRHDIAPLLATRFPNYVASLARAGRHAAEADEMLEALAKIDLDWDGTNASASTLDSLPLARQMNALYHWLGWQGAPVPSQSQLNDWAAQLFRPAQASKPQLAGGHDFVIRRANNHLLLQAKYKSTP